MKRYIRSSSEIGQDASSSKFQQDSESKILQFLKNKITILFQSSVFEFSTFTWIVSESSATAKFTIRDKDKDRICLKLNSTWHLNKYEVSLLADFSLSVVPADGIENDFNRIISYLSTRPGSDLDYVFKSELEPYAEEYLDEFIESYRYSGNALILYLRASSFRGWDSSRSVDLGLHLSYEKDARSNKGSLYKVVLNKSNLKIKEVSDVSNFSTLDGFYKLLDECKIRYNRNEIRSLYDPSSRANTSSNFRNLLLDNNINALRYVDEYDNAGDLCLCILDGSLILSYSKIS